MEIKDFFPGDMLELQAFSSSSINFFIGYNISLQKVMCTYKKNFSRLYFWNDLPLEFIKLEL